MVKENYMFFAKSGTVGDANSDAAMYPVSSFMSTQALSATTTGVYFKDVTGDYNDTSTNGGKVNLVTLTHVNISADANIHTKVAKALAKIAANAGKGKVLTVVDTANGVVAEELEAIKTSLVCSNIQNTQ